MINYYVMCCFIPVPFFHFCFVFSENISPFLHVDNSTYLSYFCKQEFRLSSKSRCSFCLSVLDIVEKNVKTDTMWKTEVSRGEQWNKINTSCYWWGQIILFETGPNSALVNEHKLDLLQVPYTFEENWCNFPETKEKGIYTTCSSGSIISMKLFCIYVRVTQNSI